MHYTYAHFRKSDGLCFYIGKGKGDRAWTSSNDRSVHWHNVADKHGLRVEIVAEWGTAAEAFEHERVLIDSFRYIGHPLVNMKDGGEGGGGPKSPSTRYKLRASVKKALCGKSDFFAQHAKNVWASHTLEERSARIQKISDKAKGRDRSDWHIQGVADYYANPVKQANRIAGIRAAKAAMTDEERCASADRCRAQFAGKPISENARLARVFRATASRFFNVPYHKLTNADMELARAAKRLGVI